MPTTFGFGQARTPPPPLFYLNFQNCWCTKSSPKILDRLGTPPAFVLTASLNYTRKEFADTGSLWEIQGKSKFCLVQKSACISKLLVLMAIRSTWTQIRAFCYNVCCVATKILSVHDVLQAKWLKYRMCYYYFC